MRIQDLKSEFSGISVNQSTSYDFYYAKLIVAFAVNECVTVSGEALALEIIKWLGTNVGDTYSKIGDQSKEALAALSRSNKVRKQADSYNVSINEHIEDSKPNSNDKGYYLYRLVDIIWDNFTFKVKGQVQTLESYGINKDTLKEKCLEYAIKYDTEDYQENIMNMTICKEALRGKINDHYRTKFGSDIPNDKFIEAYNEFKSFFLLRSRNSYVPASGNPIAILKFAFSAFYVPSSNDPTQTMSNLNRIENSRSIFGSSDDEDGSGSALAYMSVASEPEETRSDFAKICNELHVADMPFMRITGNNITGNISSLFLEYMHVLCGKENGVSKSFKDYYNIDFDYNHEGIDVKETTYNETKTALTDIVMVTMPRIVGEPNAVKKDFEVLKQIRAYVDPNNSRKGWGKLAKTSNKVGYTDAEVFKIVTKDADALHDLLRYLKERNIPIQSFNLDIIVKDNLQFMFDSYEDYKNNYEMRKALIEEAEQAQPIPGLLSNFAIKQDYNISNNAKVTTQVVGTANGLTSTTVAKPIYPLNTISDKLLTSEVPGNADATYIDYNIPYETDANGKPKVNDDQIMFHLFIRTGDIQKHLNNQNSILRVKLVKLLEWYDTFMVFCSRKGFWKQDEFVVEFGVAYDDIVKSYVAAMQEVDEFINKMASAGSDNFKPFVGYTKITDDLLDDIIKGVLNELLGSSAGNTNKDASLSAILLFLNYVSAYQYRLADIRNTCTDMIKSILGKTKLPDPDTLKTDQERERMKTWEDIYLQSEESAGDMYLNLSNTHLVEDLSNQEGNLRSIRFSGMYYSMAIGILRSAEQLFNAIKNVIIPDINKQERTPLVAPSNHVVGLVNSLSLAGKGDDRAREAFERISKMQPSIFYNILYKGHNPFIYNAQLSGASGYTRCFVHQYGYLIPVDYDVSTDQCPIFTDVQFSEICMKLKSIL